MTGRAMLLVPLLPETDGIANVRVPGNTVGAAGCEHSCCAGRRMPSHLMPIVGISPWFCRGTSNWILLGSILGPWSSEASTNPGNKCALEEIKKESEHEHHQVDHDEKAELAAGQRGQQALDPEVAVDAAGRNRKGGKPVKAYAFASGEINIL